MVSAGPAAQKAQLPALTGLRSVAALAVVLYHFSTYYRAGVLGNGVGALVLRRGYVGVEIFFMLSGFILAYTYLPRGASFCGTRAQFYVARVARIYPAYLLSLGLAALPALWGAFHPGPGTVVSTLLMQVAWDPHADLSWAGPGWTLSDEAVFYALFPLLALPLVRLRSRVLWGILVLCCLLDPLPSVVAAVQYPALLGAVAPTSAAMDWLVVTHRLPLLQLPRFVAGVALGVLFLRRQGRAPQERGRWALLAASMPLLAAAALALLLAYPSALLGLLIPNGLVDPLIGVLLYGLAAGRGPLAWLLATPAAVALGEVSYGAYLFNLPLWGILTHVLGVPTRLSAAQDPTAGALVLAAILLTAACALLSYALLETPARRGIRHLAGVHHASSPRSCPAPGPALPRRQVGRAPRVH